VSGARIIRSVLSHGVLVGNDSVVEDSVLLDKCSIGKGVRMKKVIVDHEVIIPDGTTIGLDHEEDKSRFTISDGGVVVVPRGMRLD
jgi:glucose-1-phosphate adenylyltransferase